MVGGKDRYGIAIGLCAFSVASRCWFEIPCVLSIRNASDLQIDHAPFFHKTLRFRAVNGLA